jgi:hypothetical protein
VTAFRMQKAVTGVDLELSYPAIWN